MSGHAESPFFFISYSRRDLVRVEELKALLDELGLNVWFDQQSILVGQDWQNEIYDGIRACAGLLLMLSPASTQSEWVRKEYEYALEAGVPVFPVVVAEFNIDENPLPHLNFVDFSSIPLDDLDDPNLLEHLHYFFQSLCDASDYPGCTEIRDRIELKITSPILEQTIYENRNKLVLSQTFLENTRQEYRNEEWNTAVDPNTSEELANIATDVRTYGAQLARDAARVIGLCSDKRAVGILVEKAQKRGTRQQALEALRHAWEARERGIRGDLLEPIAWRVRRYIVQRQLFGEPIANRVVFSVGAVALGIMVTLFTEFSDPRGLFPVARISYAISGIAYALFIGLALVGTQVVFPRLRVLGWARYLLSIFSGWLVLVFIFTIINFALYRRVPSDWVQYADLLWLSLLFLAGYVLSALIAPSSLLRSLARLGLVFAGMFLALAIPCAWPVSQTKLLYFSDDCVLKAGIISGLLAVVYMLPEITRHLSERGGLLYRALLTRIANARPVERSTS